MVLTTVVEFADPTIMQTVIEPVMKLLGNKNEQIRKNGVMCLYRLYQVYPVKMPDCEDRMRKIFRENVPSAMESIFAYFKEKILKNIKSWCLL